MTDPLTTRIAVAIHGATPPNPDAALALHRAQAERVLPVVEAENARLRAAVEGVLNDSWIDYEAAMEVACADDLRAALVTAEEPPA